MTGKSVFVIAEAGVNHNGAEELGIALVDAAAQAGANAVKFQTFRAGKLVTQAAPKAAYQIVQTGVDESQYRMIQSLELSPALHRRLADRSRQRNIAFLSTPFDEASLDFLVDEIGLDTIKLPSGEITNIFLLIHAARRAGKVILSTGMSSLGEVELGLSALAWGALNPLGFPKHSADLGAAFANAEGQAFLRDRVSLLHCTTEYPAKYAEVNLNAMETLRRSFGTAVGLSDHTPGIAVPIAAAALGADIVEKHFTMDRGLPGPDHAASLLPGELAEMVAGIRAVEVSLGSSSKQATASEIDNRPVIRKSLVAACPIKKGELLSLDNLTAKRPGTGWSPMDAWRLVGKPAERDYDKDDLI